jgi:hypothetical protein
MKKIILLTSFVLSITLYGQPQPFTKVIYDFVNPVTAHSVASAHDGGYMIAGEIQGAPMILHTDSAGDVLWTKTFGTGWNDRVSDIIKTSDSCFVAVGKITQAGDFNAFVIKIDATGLIKWSVRVGSIMFDEAFGIIETNDHGFLITGMMVNSNTGFNNSIVAKIDSAGVQQWYHEFEITGADNAAHSARQTADGGYIVCGTLTSDNFLLKLNSSGVAEWAKKYIPPTYSFAYDIEVLNDGFLTAMMAGNLIVMKTDTAGNFIWAKEILGGGTYMSSLFPKIRRDANGNFIFIIGSDWTGSPGIVVVTDAALNVLNRSMLSMTPVDVTVSSDGGNYYTGNGPLLGVGNSHVLIPHIGTVKTNSAGFAPDCIFSDVISIPSGIVLTNSAIVFTPLQYGSVSSSVIPDINMTFLTQVGCVDFTGNIKSQIETEMVKLYPNPAEQYFTIEFSEMQSTSQVEIFDATGALKYNLTVEKGIDAKNISPELVPGIYIVVAKQNEFSVYKKLVIQ